MKLQKEKTGLQECNNHIPQWTEATSYVVQMRRRQSRSKVQVPEDKAL